MKREIQIYKTSKKTGKSGAGEAPADVVLDGIVIQHAGVNEKIVQWRSRKRKICWLIPKCGFLRPVRAAEMESNTIKLIEPVYSLDMSRHARRYDLSDSWKMLCGVSLRVAQSEELQTVSDVAGKE